MRPLCRVCGRNHAAINGYHNGKVYYRKLCNPCIRKNKKLARQTPRWQSAGYKKKSVCDKCGFRSRHASQLVVMHVDGNLNNCELRNLKTVCLNCLELLKRQDLPWRVGDLEPDA